MQAMNTIKNWLSKGIVSAISEIVLTCSPGTSPVKIPKKHPPKAARRRLISIHSPFLLQAQVLLCKFEFFPQSLQAFLF